MAARRYVKYWEQRLHVFGPEKAFLPLTLDGALKDDEVALTIGFMNYTGQFDPSGRAVPFADPSKQDKTKYTPKSMCRSLWYLLHTCLQNTDTQKKGVIVCIFPRNVRLGQLDRKLMKLNSDSLKACIPVRVSCLHICHPPKIFQMIFPIVKCKRRFLLSSSIACLKFCFFLIFSSASFVVFLGERLQKRVKIHSGSEEQVLTELEKYGLTKDMVASPIGGNAEVDMAKYIAECRKAGK